MIVIIMTTIFDMQNSGIANAIKLNHKNKFVGTVLWTTFDFLTFGVFEKNAKKNNQSQ